MLLRLYLIFSTFFGQKIVYVRMSHYTYNGSILIVGIEHDLILCVLYAAWIIIFWSGSRHFKCLRREIECKFQDNRFPMTRKKSAVLTVGGNRFSYNLCQA